jgi:hypothetical protein
MSYEAEISRRSPAFLLFVLDQSTSMGHPIAEGTSKAAYVADVLNRTFLTIISTSTKVDGVRDYFFFSVIAYSGVDARPGLALVSVSDWFVPASRLAAHPIRVETRERKVEGPSGELVTQNVKFPVWFEPVSRGKTSMCAGLRMAKSLIQEWFEGHPGSYPPTVLHVTDGHPTDGDPEPIADEIRQLANRDGAALLFNLHVDVGSGGSIVFPNSEAKLKDKYAKKLFRMSSELPPRLLAGAQQRGYSLAAGARGFMFNASLESIVDFFDLGTRPSAIADR